MHLLGPASILGAGPLKASLFSLVSPGSPRLLLPGGEAAM